MEVLRKLWFHNAHSSPRINMTAVQLQSLTRDPTWFKAVFYRDPVDRYVSAYLSKCLAMKWKRRHCKYSFGSTNVSFEESIGILSRLPAHGNAHWLQQYQFCDDLRPQLSRFNFIQEMESESINEKIRSMFAQAKLPIYANTSRSIDRYFPQPAARTRMKSGDITDSASRAQHYFAGRSDLLAAVIDHYMEDYLLFNITLAPWQEMLLRSQGSRHNNLLSKLSPYLKI